VPPNRLPGLPAMSLPRETAVNFGDVDSYGAL
jgi:hypothetical protein